MSTRDPKSARERMQSFMSCFGENRERLMKYTELALLGETASPLAYQDRSSLRRIAIVLTTRCNLRCVWCHREERTIQRSGYLENEMDFDRLAAFLPQLEGFSSLHWGGLGEPMLYPKFYEATRLARQYVPSVKTTSNGTALTRHNVRRLVDCGLSFLEVSIDGFDGVTNRKYRGAPEDGIIERLEYLSANSDIPIQINSVLADVNYDSLFDAVDRLKNVRNIVRLHTIPLFMTRHMERIGLREIRVEQHAALLHRWRERIRELSLGWELFPDWTETDFDPVIFLKRAKNVCFTPYEDPMINVRGELVPCGRLQHIGLGNVFDLGFDAAWNGPAMIKWREAQMKGHYGRDCVRECHMVNTCKRPLSDADRARIHPNLRDAPRGLLPIVS